MVWDNSVVVVDILSVRPLVHAQPLRWRTILYSKQNILSIRQFLDSNYGKKSLPMIGFKMSFFCEFK